MGQMHARHAHVPDPSSTARAAARSASAAPGSTPTTRSSERPRRSAECRSAAAARPPSRRRSDSSSRRRCSSSRSACASTASTCPTPSSGEGGRGIFRAGPGKQPGAEASKTFEEAEKACQPILQELRDRAPDGQGRVVSRKALAAAGAAVVGIAALGALVLAPGRRRGGRRCGRLRDCDRTGRPARSRSAHGRRRNARLWPVALRPGSRARRHRHLASSAGAVVGRGGTLFAVDGRSVRLLYGATPLWRRLGPGVSDGEDVRQLERNLVALGHDPNGMDVDDDFDSDTAAAVRDWQEAIGVAETRAVEPGRGRLPTRRTARAITRDGASVRPSSRFRNHQDDGHGALRRRSTSTPVTARSLAEGRP